MKQLLWEWHCKWIDEYEDVIERHYADIGDREKFSDCKLSDDEKAVYMVYGLTLHWNCDGDWTDIEQERAYVNELSQFSGNEISKKIPKYIINEFHKYRHKMKPQGDYPCYVGEH